MNIKQFLSIKISFFLIFTPSFLNAAIIEDSSAPKAHQPHITRTNNGADLINITKPNEKGISINEYSKFDTTSRGTVLNNSKRGVDTLTGGYVEANPNLSSSSATLILNKVNSNEKSLLKGNIEIAGDKADLIIANPSGISVDGLHIINSKSSTLTTGNIKFDNTNNITSIDVKNGEIKITGKGLKDDSDYTKLISNTFILNSNIHSNNLDIITGKNELNKDNLVISSLKDNDNVVSIDSSSLGGMYANKIKLITTSKGVGVNNSGIINANDISINSNGDVINKNTILASDNLNIKSNTSISNDNLIASNKNLELQTRNLINNGSLNSKELSIKTTALNNQKNITSDVLNIASSDITNSGEIITNSNLNIQANNISNKNSTLGKEQSNAQDNSAKDNDIKSNTNKSSNIIASNITNNSAKIISNSLSLDIKNYFLNDSSNLYLKSINNNIDSFKNLNSNLIIDDKVDLNTNTFQSINSKLSFKNGAFIFSNSDITNKNSILSSQSDINFVSKDNVYNLDSMIRSDKTLSISSSGYIYNTASKLLANNIILNSNDNIKNTNTQLSSLNDISILSAKNLSFANSSLLSNKDIKLTASSDINNLNSDIKAVNNIFIISNSLINDKLIKANNLLNINSKNILNTGNIEANGISIDALNLNNKNSILSSSDMNIYAHNLINDSAKIYANGLLDITTKDMFNQNSSSIFGNYIKINSNNISNLSSSNISSNDDINIRSKHLSNNSSNIQSNKNILITADTFDNLDAKVTSAKDLYLQTSNYPNHGLLIAGNNLNISTKDDINYNGGFSANSDISVTTTKNFINNTKLISNNNLFIKANTITNFSSLLANNILNLEAINIYNNKDISSKNALKINSDSLINKNANIYANQAFLDIDNIENLDKSSIFTTNNMLIDTTNITNANSSNIISLGDMKIYNSSSDDKKSNTINNISSLIYTGGNLDINAKSLNNIPNSIVNTRHETTNSSIDLRGDKTIHLSINLKNLKQNIIDEYMFSNTPLDKDTLNKELFKRAMLSDEKLYALNLQKDNSPYGNAGARYYNDIILDENTNNAIISTSHIRDNEETRRINYTITKEILNEKDLVKFIPSQIISKNNILFNTTNLLNDKSQIYAYNDIYLKDILSLENKDLKLNHNISSTGEYGWYEKKRKKIGIGHKKVHHGGFSPTETRDYSQVGIPFVFSAGGNIIGSVTNLKNGVPSRAIFTNNPPMFDTAYTRINLSNKFIPNVNDNTKINIDSAIKYKSIDSIKNADIVLLSRPNFTPNSITPYKNTYLNTDYVFAAPNSDYLHNKLGSYYTYSMLDTLNPLRNISFFNSSIFSADANIILNSDGTIQNYSNINSGDTIYISANNVINHQGSMVSKNDLIIKAKSDISNLSSSITGSSVNLNANNIYNQTLSKYQTLQRSDGFQNYTSIGKTSSITSTIGNTILNANSLAYINGDINSNSNIVIKAGNIVVDTTNNIGSFNFGDSKNYFKGSHEKHNSSNLNAKNNIIFNSNNDISINSANINANNSVILNAKNSINLLSSKDSEYLEGKSTTKGFLSKSTTLTKSLQESINSTNIQANNIALNSNSDINLQSVNLKANDNISLVSNSGNINILPSYYTNYYESKTSKSSFGGISKKESLINDTTNSLSSSNVISSNALNLKANNIDVVASNLTSKDLSIDANKLNLISSKDTYSHSEFSSNSGILTATIEDKGKITEVEIPAIIKVKDKFILNGKDITQSLDIKIVDEISQTLNSQNFKDSIIKELSSNSNTPLSQKEINQVRAILNSKEWNDKTTTISGVGALVTTAVVTYLTAGAGSALASSLTAASATTASAVSAVTSAVITNASLQATNMVISNGKVKFDINSLTKSALSAGLGAYANSYISGIDSLANSNILDTKYLDISYADTLNTLSNSAIQSGVYGSSFKDALLSNISTQTSNYLFKQAGNLGLVTNSKDRSLSKTLTHSIVGGSINAMQGDSFKDGALISGITEILRPLSTNLGKEEQLLSSQLIGILSGAIIDSDKGAKEGFNLATSSEVYNRQLHKDEEEFLNKHSKEFKSYYEKQTNKTISEDEAKSLLLLSSKHIVDAKDNGIFNILNFFGKTDFSKDELNTGINFIYQKSKGLKFIDRYKENFTLTDFFSATDEQFYNHNYNPNTPQGLSDESFMFIPSVKVGVSGVKGVEVKSILKMPEKQLKYSNVDKITKQMKKRGWTEKEIREAMQTKGIKAIGKNGPAIRYVHPKTGKSVVIDNKTNEIFHVGGEGFKYDY